MMASSLLVDKGLDSEYDMYCTKKGKLELQNFSYQTEAECVQRLFTAMVTRSLRNSHRSRLLQAFMAESVL